MWQMVFACVPVEGWIIHPYVNCFFNCFSEVLVLSPFYTEAVNNCGMTCDVMMVIERGGSLKMFLEHLSKCSCKFTNIFSSHSNLEHLYL